MKKIYKILFIMVLSFLFLEGIEAAPRFYIKLECPNSALTNQNIECVVSAMASGENIKDLDIGITTNDYVSYENSTLDTYVEATDNYIEIGTINLKINNQSGSGKLTISIKPTTENNTVLETKTKNAYIDIKSNIATLSSLKIDGKSVPNFNKNTIEYSTSTTKNKVTISASPTSSSADISGTGVKNLNCGSNNYTIRVTSETGTSKRYNLEINRKCDKNVYLSGIDISEGTLNPIFDKTITNYTVEVDKKIETITVTGKKSASSQTITGNVTNQKLEYGDNKINITVTSQTGEKQVYTVNVIRKDNRDSNAYLSSLSLSSGNIKFDKNTFEYETKVLYNIENIEILAVPEIETSKVTITGNKNLKVGENIITIKVKSEKGEEKDYTVKVTRLEEGQTLGDNANIKNIIIKNYNLKFETNKFKYKLVIDDEDQLDIKVIMEDESASYEIVGNNNLKNGSVIKIITTSLDGTSENYSIEITKSDYTLYYILAGLTLLLLIAIPVFVYFKSVKEKKKNLDVNGYEQGKEYEDTTSTRTIISSNSKSVVELKEELKETPPVVNEKNIIPTSQLSSPKTNFNQQTDVNGFDTDLQSYVPNESNYKCPYCGRELLGTPNECPYCKNKIN